MTPLQIEILLHYHTRPGDHPDAARPPPPYDDAFNYFLRNGYLIPKNSATTPGYKATEKLHVYCEALCNVPEPVQKWVIKYE